MILLFFLYEKHLILNQDFSSYQINCNLPETANFQFYCFIHILHLTISIYHYKLYINLKFVLWSIFLFRMSALFRGEKKNEEEKPPCNSFYSGDYCREKKIHWDHSEIENERNVCNLYNFFSLKEPLLL